MENERGYWENLPRELSMGDQGSRQLTPHPSPPRPETDQSGPLADALEDAPGNLLDAPEFHQEVGVLVSVTSIIIKNSRSLSTMVCEPFFTHLHQQG